MALIDSLEWRRKEMKMTQGAFAKHLGVDPGEYSRLLKYGRKPSAGVLMKVQRAFPDLIRDTLELGRSGSRGAGRDKG